MDPDRREIRDEIELYLDLRTEELIAQGLDPAEARRRGLEKFGSPARVEDECVRIAAAGVRDRHGVENGREYMGSVFRDLRFALRTLRKSPGFAVAATVTLALGIGANTAIFSVVNGVLLQPLRFHDPDALVYVWHSPLDDPDDHTVATPGNFYDWQREARSFDALAAYSWFGTPLTGVGEPEQLWGVQSAGSLFDVLRVPPFIGRTFGASDDRPGGEPVVVLSHALWTRVFNRDPQALGETVTLGGTPFTVIGVMPPDFRFPTHEAEFWTPALWSEEFRANRTEYFLSTIGRLGSGRTIDAAEQEMQSIMAHLRAEHPQANSELGAAIVPMREEVVSDVETRLVILMSAVVVILLIACANIANLLLARGTRRQREIALRQSLGAARGRLIRQVLTESLVLGLTGGALGLLVGFAFLRAILGFLPGELPRLDEVAIDPSVLGFTLVLSLGASMLFGAMPAVQSSARSPIDALRGGGKASAREGRMRGSLVVVEIALAMILLTGAGLLVRSFLLLQRVDPGFSSDRILTLRLSLPGRDYDPVQREQFFYDIAQAIGNLPGVSSAAFTTNLPVTGRGTGAWITFMDRPLPPDETPPIAVYRVVTPGYLETIGIPLVRGRYLTRGDGPSGTPSVVINLAAAEEFWPGQDPLGREITLGPDGGWIVPSTVVGIVQNVQNLGLGEPAPPIVYMPHALTPWRASLSLVARTRVEPTSIAASVRRIIRDRDGKLPITDMATMDEVISRTIETERAAMVLLGLFSAVAMIMAAVGVFGVMSYTVGQRTKELGIRIALGAKAAGVLRMVVWNGMAKTVLGIGLGVAGAFGVTRVMAGMLYEVSAVDPITFAAVAVLLAGVAMLACYLPARRATKVDPVEVLRYD